MSQNPFGIVKKTLVQILLEQMQSAILRKGSDKIPDNSDEEDMSDVEKILNIPYMNRDEVPLAMDIFKPKDSGNKDLPVIVTIHGGGLVMGDRKISRKFSERLASKGYLVFSIEYRLVPRASVCEELDDICAGMDIIGRKLVEFNVDYTRIFLAAESAGAYLALYVAAMKKSKNLQKAIGYEPSRMKFKAIGLISGMLYTNKNDLIGALLAEQFYGEKLNDRLFMQYMNPEDPEIIDNVPPIFLITSRGDFLNRYTLEYNRALKNAGIASKMLYYGEKELEHAFARFRR